MPDPAVPTTALTPRQRKQLRALAHPLEPIVQVGKAGLSEALLRAVSRALLDHELIKVRLYEPEDKRALADELAARSASTLCGLLGHTVILYKRHPKRPRSLKSGVAASAPRSPKRSSKRTRAIPDETRKP